MAKVNIVEVPRGQMFGGKGSAVFSPFRKKQSDSEIVGLTPEERLAQAAEVSLLKFLSQPQNTEKGEKDR
jgi:hypothetical protein